VPTIDIELLTQLAVSLCCVRPVDSQSNEEHQEQPSRSVHCPAVKSVLVVFSVVLYQMRAVAGEVHVLEAPPPPLLRSTSYGIL